MEWTHIWQEIDDYPVVVQKGVQIFVDSKKKGLFKGNDASKILLVSNPKICDRIVEELSKFVVIGEKNDLGEGMAPRESRHP